MRKKVLLFTAFILASLIVIIPSSVSAVPDYEQTKYDPKSDVMRVRTGGDFKFAPWDDVEITMMTSHKEGAGISASIELTMTVEGKIQNSDAYKYVFVVIADGDEYIFGAYQNGQGIGFEMGSDTLILGVDAEGAGTDTLTITFLESSIGPPQNSFEFSGATVYSEGDYERYIDLGTPDKLVLITEPSDGSTVSGSNLQINGVVMESIDGQPSGNVEIKIDDGTWEAVTGNDPWSYSLDTTALADGEHDIYVRVGTSPLDNGEDHIKINVDQNTAGYKSFNQLPSIHVGDQYHYETVGTPSVSGIDLSVTNEMDLEVQSYETVTVGTTDYEAYKIYGHTEGSQDLGYFSYTNTVDRWSWREDQGYGTVKDNTVSVVDVTLRPETTVDTTTEYSPPLEQHNDFNVEVGFDNNWITPTINSDSETETFVEGEEPTSDSYGESFVVTGECLSYKISHNVLNNNYPDIYVIRTYYENPGVSIVEYYSPDLGVPVQIDTFDTSRNKLFSLGLKSYIQIPFSAVISEINFDPDPPLAEQDNKILVKIRNVGNEDTEDFTITVNDGESQVDQQTVSVIPVGETKDVEITWSPKTEGNHTLTVMISYEGTPLDDETRYVNVGAPSSDDSSNMMMFILIIIIVIVVVLVLVMILMKKRGAGEATPKETETAAETAAAPVTIATEPEPQVTPATTETQMLTETIQCPSCKQGFTVNYESKPVRVKCPNCGTEGELN
jgi:hypothetical protein